MNDFLLVNALYYGLFDRNNSTDTKKLIQSLPKNAFGIFSTIRRSNTLKTYPIDIHGCIGYWDPNFSPLKKQDLYTHLLRVVKDSLWNDQRKTYFPQIEDDPNTYLELDFMMNPIYEINRETGIIEKLDTLFTNNTFGIIIQSRDGSNKATYLPKVFPNISWKKLVESIKEKANIVYDDFDLFAYKILQIKSTFFTILTGKAFIDNSIQRFSKLLLDTMNDNRKYPFIYAYMNKDYVWNQDDDVRNISTLAEIFRYIQIYHNIATPKQVKTIKTKILGILENIGGYSSQSLSFLGYVYTILGLNNADYCRKLTADLERAEEEFEKPEIIIGLNQAQCLVDKSRLSTYNSSDSIFKMNWTIQALHSFDDVLTVQMRNILEEKVKEMLPDIKTVETNYIAVAFEALCFTFVMTRSATVKNLIFRLLFELELRKTGANVLYAFLDGNARVDISGHVNNGLFMLSMI